MPAVELVISKSVESVEQQPLEVVPDPTADRSGRMSAMIG
jgi:hypothetical protein